eukprot:1161994-Pelagomonas_calceolata.AAC.4
MYANCFPDRTVLCSQRQTQSAAAAAAAAAFWIGRSCAHEDRHRMRTSRHFYIYSASPCIPSAAGPEGAFPFKAAIWQLA